MDVESVGTEVGRSAQLTVCGQDEPGWLRLVDHARHATAFHTPAWSNAVSGTYGFPGFVLAMRGPDGGFLAGVPVMEIRDLLGRPRLVSLPFTDHCPPLVEEGVDAGEFVRQLARWQATGEVPPIEVRAELPPGAGALTKTIGTRHVVDLEPDPDVLFRHLHRNRIQKRVRRAREFGVEVTLSRSIADLETFYRLHCQTRRRQGVPVQPRRFIRSIWERVIEPGHGFVILARVRETPIATALFLTWNRHLIYKYGASDRAQWRLGANFLVHWTAMEWGCVNGYLRYDFGRTDAGHESLREFKAAWGATETALLHTRIGASADPRGRARMTGILSHVIRRSPTVVCRAVGELLYRYAA
jgi:CelD/BcsL family acetyltransferase involved in cellulose biosynthesis